MRSIQLHVDLTDAPRRLLHVTADLPVRPASTASFTTPLWLCGSHKPNGPVDRIAGLYFTADQGRTTLQWRRDATQIHIYHVDVPSGVTTVRATFDAVIKTHLTRRMTVVKWETAMMHPAYAHMGRIMVEATIQIPGNWDYATTLHVDTETTAPNGAEKTIKFTPLSAERLEDSPVLIGQHLSCSNITKDGKHQLCVAFSEPELTKIPQDRIDKLERLIYETAAVFGPGPYQQYKFLCVSSDILVPGEQRAMGGGGLEHAESAHLYTSGRVFADDDLFDWTAYLFSHEYVHVWNGKYRRPAGHVPSDFSTPLDGTMLWVYEGLTHYYGYVLAARSGLAALATLMSKLAVGVADMQCESGRAWRSTEDTGRGLALKMSGAGYWSNYSRNDDYYDEGVLFWLDADTLIREKSQGAKTLDDFARVFFDAKGKTQPLVMPYTLNEIISTLNETLPHNWATFIRERVQTPQADVNTAGFARAGYDFTYTEEEIASPVPSAQQRLAVWHSLGVRVEEDGTVSDVRRFSQADSAGLAPPQKITHVDGKEYSLEALTAAIAATTRSGGGDEAAAVHVRLTSDEDSWDARIPHSIGLLYPALKRHGGPDMLVDIFTPRAAK